MEDMLQVAGVPAIVAVVYWIVNLIKYTTKNNEKVLSFIPLIATGIGVVCGLVAFFAVPNVMPTDNGIVAVILGGASGLSATGFNQIIKQAGKMIDSNGKEKE